MGETNGQRGVDETHGRGAAPQLLLPLDAMLPRRTHPQQALAERHLLLPVRMPLVKLLWGGHTALDRCLEPRGVEEPEARREGTEKLFRPFQLEGGQRGERLKGGTHVTTARLRTHKL